MNTELAKESELLFAGYSYHNKPYHSINKEGLKVYLFRLQTEGLGQTRIGQTTYRLEAGDLILCHPDDHYELHIDQATENKVWCADYHFFCQGSWIDSWWETISPRPRKMHIPNAEELMTIFRQMAIEDRRESPMTKEINAHFLKILCMMINRLVEDPSISEGKNTLAYRMKHFIEENATSPFKIEDVAKHVGLSVSRSVGLYKSVFNQSIMQYALEVRLNTARDRILFSPMSLEQIAELSGFANYTYFHRVFRAKFGLSPRAFRQTHAVSR